MCFFWSYLPIIFSLPTYFWRVLSVISPLLVLTVSGVAVYIAILSRREARVAAHASLFYQQMWRYSSIEMHEALGIIGRLIDLRNDNFGVFLQFVKKYHKKEDVYILDMIVDGEHIRKYHFHLMYEEANQARFTVSQFYTLSFDLFSKFKVLGEDYFKEICSIDTFAFMYRIIEWLELAHNPDYNRKEFTGLLERSGRTDIEDLREQRPPPTWDEVEQLIKSNPINS